ncbi:MAG TPA: Mpo1-like protein [Steroidobacteraceae bacterium]|nr:Mpo1-like protein [Steroidobacteraceae bacterium]
MDRIATMLRSYGSYHRDPRNRMTHYVGVPLISYAVLAALALVGWPQPSWLPLDRLVLAVLALLYLYWDLRLGLMLTGLLVALAALAECTTRLGVGATQGIAAAAFIGGWAMQLLGHRLEGNRPALLDNLRQILVAPMYLTAELAFALGWRTALRAAILR